LKFHEVLPNFQDDPPHASLHGGGNFRFWISGRWSVRLSRRGDNEIGARLVGGHSRKAMINNMAAEKHADAFNILN
jgi:hypothetical protein